MRTAFQREQHAAVGTAEKLGQDRQPLNQVLQSEVWHIEGGLRSPRELTSRNPRSFLVVYSGVFHRFPCSLLIGPWPA